MKYRLLDRDDFYFEDEYQEYLDRQRNTNCVEFWNSIDPNVGEALYEYRNDKESNQFDT